MLWILLLNSRGPALFLVSQLLLPGWEAWSEAVVPGRGGGPDGWNLPPRHRRMPAPERAGTIPSTPAAVTQSRCFNHHACRDICQLLKSMCLSLLSPDPHRHPSNESRSVDTSAQSDRGKSWDLDVLRREPHACRPSGFTHGGGRGGPWGRVANTKRSLFFLLCRHRCV